ncbi:MAG: nicotinate (nicotinamide) nucleotide adenylyltransferase [Treponema sp.]|nr:nicotinate (nicotinamide) nucleotide adenylyltransferase [Treponema sp.]
MKLAVLGGSFNPIHIGHLALADDVCSSLGYDKVLFVPTGTPVHKEMNGAIPADKRLAMVRAACRGDRRFVAEACEIKRGGLSYTWDTVIFLQEKYRSTLTGKIGLIIGEDLLSEFHLWNHAPDLAQLCTLILARRPSLSKKSEAVLAHENRPIGEYGKIDASRTFSISDEPLFANAVCIENPFLAISSTDIRARIASGKSWRYLVPPAVFRYIVNGGLYGCTIER